MKTFRFNRLGVLLSALALLLPARAQLQWSVFNETSTTAAPAATAASGVAVSVPAGQRVTLVANNLVPIDLSRDGTEAYVTISFKVSGGLSNLSAGTRAIGYGLFNNNGTATNYADDAGYFTWLNGRNTGSLIEQRRRIGDGTSPSLLNPTGSAFNNMSTGQSSPTPGSLNDGSIYSLTLHLMSRGGAISFGNTSSNTTGGGIVLSGPGIQAITFSNPDTPASAFVFNEIGFMFLNTTGAAQTLTITGVTSSSNSLVPINPPAIVTPPAALSLNPGQAGALAVVATGTPPLAYQWKKDGANVAGGTGATLAFPSAAAADAGSYTVTIANTYGNVTSSAAALTVTTAPIPATITNQPAGQTVNIGDSASFSVAAYGSAPVAYQWRKDGAAIAGATGTTYSIAKVAAGDAGSYTVVVTAGGGATTATSSAATLAVNTAPAITTQPQNITAKAGDNVSLSVVATGSPAPSYQWSRNGSAIAGATSATLALNNLTLANTGVYTVALLNDVGAVTSAPAVVAIPSTMAATSFYPATGATGINPDTPLRITFDQAPVVGRTGLIKIVNAADDKVVETIDLGAALKQRTVGTNATAYNYFPVIVTDKTAAIYPRGGVLAYGQTYYVTIEQSALLDASGGSFTGVGDKTTWRFSTKASGPAAGATALTVAADGSGDFTTVQGAIDFVPAGNAQRVVITVKKGTYPELVYLGPTKPFVTIRGEDRAQSVITYANNNNLNGTTATRAVVSLAGNDAVLETITIRNTTPQGGSQAEALFTGAQRVLVNRVNLLSRQDTLLTNIGTAFITDSYIEGNTDFMWGTAAAYYQRCELKALDTGTATEGYYTQIRNGATTFGAVYVDCKLTAAEGVVGKSTYYLGRIDPNPGNFPYSQCYYINCAMGAHISPAGWQLNNATASPTIQYAEYRSTDLSGALLDPSRRIGSSRQLSEAEAQLWRNPAFVLGGWAPQIAPTIESSPVATSAVAGSVARLSVLANGAPQPALQWFKNGTAIEGATSDTLTLANVQPADAANYTVTATNGSGSVTSAAGALSITRSPLAGVYFGTITATSSGQTAPAVVGDIALYIRDSGSAVVLARNPNGAIRTASVDGSGRLRGSGTFAIEGTVAANGTASGTLLAAGGSAATPAVSLGAFTATRVNTGASAAYAGYYQIGANGSGATANLVVAANGTAFAVVQNGATLEAATGTIDASGALSVKTNSFTLAATITANASTATATVTPASGAALTLAGVNDAIAEGQRLREFSARARVDANAPAFAGFVVTGDAPTSVLVRAVGPTLGDIFAVAGALANPKIDLYRGGTLVASNVGWTSASNPTEIALGAVQAGAFPLRTNVADSALRLTLAPGAYTAVMSSASGATAGIGLLEVYDLTAGAAGQRLVNLSTRGPVGNGTNALLCGFVVAGAQPKRVLVRGVGPGLAGFGVTGTVARPVLTLYRGTTQVAQNAGWSTSADATAIAAGAAEVGTFALASGSADAAILVHLAPGLYTAQVTSLDGTSGTGLIEIYELP
jgi:pectin methylesterase-like acyl-CoA thioesterase